METDIDIIVIGLRSWKKKDTGVNYYVIDYVRLDNFLPKTDFLNDVLEFNNLKKKLGDRHMIKATGKRKTNQYDSLYVFDFIESKN